MPDQDRRLRAAEECERLAKRSVDAEDRMALLNMAKLWRELAGGGPSYSTSAVETSPSSRPGRRN